MTSAAPLGSVRIVRVVIGLYASDGAEIQTTTDDDGRLIVDDSAL
jgi:hypothetical protein